MEWYGILLTGLAADSAHVDVPQTHMASFQVGVQGEVLLPLSLDPGVDLRRTTYLSRMIQRWGKIPLLFLEALKLQDHRYAFIGTEDWFMSPLLQPGSFLIIDETQRRISNSGWNNEFDRPIYFFEHRQGYSCGWCHLNGEQLVLQPHPASLNAARKSIQYPKDIDLIGQVSGVAMRLDQGRRRRVRSQADRAMP